MSMAEWEAVIGLEIHVQLGTRSKLFCGCATRFGAPPNAQVCPVCLGHPGVLPAVNRQALRLGLRGAAALGAHIPRRSAWARKNYFYPDLPKGYQITQYAHPLATGGEIPYEAQGRMRSVALTRLHLEEDAGRLKHGGDEEGPSSLVDLNRCGVPLLEIVTEPALQHPHEAHAVLVSLRQIVQYIEISEGAMEKGHLRCDANISLRPVGEQRLGTKTEIKNLNSFRHVEQALAEEIRRQRALLEDGGEVSSATLLWDADARCTRLMRSKEDRPDYRYFPEPDLPDLTIENADLEAARAAIGELPASRRRRLETDHELPADEARILTRTRRVADLFEAAARRAENPGAVARFMVGELAGALGERGRSLEDAGLDASAIAQLVDMVGRGELSGRQAKAVVREMLSSGRPAAEIAADQGLEVEQGEAALLAWIGEVLAAHPRELSEYQAGKTALLRFFMGQVMRVSQGRADPAATQRLLERRLRDGRV